MNETTDELRAALEAVLSAVDAVTGAGCIDHLDCWDDADELWFKPLARARAALGRQAEVFGVQPSQPWPR
jgi:hypothetical protein